MWPILARIGPFTLHTYGLFIGLGFLAGYTWLCHELHRSGDDHRYGDGLFGVILFSGLIGSRLLYVAIEWPFYLANPLEIFEVWSGGLVFYGGLFSAVLATIVYLRIKHLAILPLIDAAAPALALGQAIGRLGCFSAGCCYGLPTKLPWGVTFSNSLSLAPLGISLHPTQLYESALDLMIFLTLALKNYSSYKPSPVLRTPSPLRERDGVREERGKGATAALYLCLYGIARFLVEFLRGDGRGGPWAGLSPSQWFSIVGLGMGAGWLSFLRTRHDGKQKT